MESSLLQEAIILLAAINQDAASSAFLEEVQRAEVIVNWLINFIERVDQLI